MKRDDDGYGGMPYRNNPQTIVSELMPLKFAKKLYRKYKTHERRMAAVDIEVPKDYRNGTRECLETARANEIKFIRRNVNDLFKN